MVNSQTLSGLGAGVSFSMSMSSIPNWDRKWLRMTKPGVAPTWSRASASWSWFSFDITFRFSMARNTSATVSLFLARTARTYRQTNFLKRSETLRSSPRLTHISTRHWWKANSIWVGVLAFSLYTSVGGGEIRVIVWNCLLQCFPRLPNLCRAYMNRASAWASVELLCCNRT